MIRCSSLAAAALCALAPIAQADEMPKRRPGLWESSMTGGDGLPPQIVKQCIDESTDATARGSMGANGSCMPARRVKTAQGIETETACKIGPMTSTSKAVISGDFNAKIRTEIVTTVIGAPGQKGPKTTTSVIEARWLGACAPGQNPGDIILPDGRVVKTPASTR